MSRLTLTLLGPPRIELDGEPVHVGRRKSVALLAYLALSHAPQSRDALATLLWPGYDQSHARGHLRRALTTLTSKLGGAWFAADQDTVSLAPIASPCYSPEPVEGAAGRAGSRLWLDVAQFRRLLADCDAHEHPSDAACPECQALLTEAVELYQDDVLAGFSLPDSPAFDEWQRYQTQRLRDELAGALERLSRCLAAQDEYDQAIAHGRRWLKLDPLHEPAHRGLMALYAQAGRRPEALRQYRECLRVLEAELGVPPSAETAALYERLREAQVTPLEKGGPAPAPSPAQLPAFLQQAQDIILSLPKEGILSYKTPTVAERPVFVAREAELAWLAGHLETALAGQSRVVFVTGGPGRGKTALMSHFARQALAAHPDLLVASGACNAYAGVGDPYLPFRETLAMLSGDVETRWAAGTISRAHARRLWAALPLVVQALLDHGPHVIDALLAGSALLSRVETFQTFSDSESLKVSELREWVERDKAHSDLEQAALFQQFTNVLLALAAQHPLLLTLDDLQWADDGSIGVLFHLGRRLEGSRVLIIGAYRPEEVAAGRGGERHPLEKVVAEIQRDFGDVSLDLSRVDETEGRGFVEALLDREPNRLGRAYRETLHRHTGGHPLFTVELLHAMQARGNLVRDHEGQWVEGPNLDWGTLPARVEAVITERVGRLSHDLRDLLAVASVEGERFSAQVVAQVQGVPERKVLRGLMELSTRHRLVRESEALQVAGTGRFVFRYQFAHALFREYLYHSLSAGERMLLHGEIGTALEGLYGDAADEIATTLAHHYDQAGIRERAAVYTLRAGDRARRAYANDEAIVHYQRVLELLGPAAELRGSQDEAEWRLAALTGLGRVHFEGGNLADAERDLRQAIALGKEIDLAPRALVRIYFRLNLVLLWQGRID
jgi:DNA-binding SARP family transcriptional activator